MLDHPRSIQRELLFIRSVSILTQQTLRSNLVLNMATLPAGAKQKRGKGRSSKVGFVYRDGVSATAGPFFLTTRLMSFI
jgi:hypothetical protein